MKILFKYATRSRRSNFIRGIKSITDNLSDNSNYHILVSVENIFHDWRIRPLPVLKCNHTYRVNPNAPTTKIDAINRDVNGFSYDWDILVNMSDDMVFIVKGFDNEIREAFRVDGMGFNLDQYIHFSDGTQKSNVSTMHIVGRDYYLRDNYIYNPAYKSLLCDVENDDKAKLRNRYRYMGDDKIIFNHLHPAWGLAPTDNQYLRSEAPEMWSHDSAIYNRNKLNNFGF